MNVIRISGTRLAVALALALASAPALAEPKVSGNLNSAHVEAQDCPITEVLDSLSHKFEFRYSSRADLTTSVTGRYEGTVLQVVRRLLNGYSFVVRSGSTGIDLTVLEAEKPQVNEPEAPRRRRRDVDHAVQSYGAAIR